MRKAERCDAGKTPSQQSWTQPDILLLLNKAAWRWISGVYEPVPDELYNLNWSNTKHEEDAQNKLLII